MLANADALFQPAMVKSAKDFDEKYNKERGETLKRYAQGGPGITWHNSRNSTIYILVIDETIEDELLR